MTDLDVVTQAANLLARRLSELDRMRLEIDVETRKIRAALAGLSSGASVVEGDEPLPPAVPAGGPWRPMFQFEKVPVRAAVKALLNSENRAFTPSEIQDRLDPVILGDRSERQIRNVIRTSLHTLRESGEAIQIDGGRTLAARWVDPETNEDSSVGAEESSVTPDENEGGGESVDLSRDSYSQDHDPRRF